MAWRTAAGQPRQTYLQPVAIRMAAQTARGEFVDLGPDDTPWGLISCALGKRANRRKFVGRFSSPFSRKVRPGDAPKPKGYDPQRHQSFWEWRDGYKGPGFSQAKAAFIALDKEVAREKGNSWHDLPTSLSELAGRYRDQLFACAGTSAEGCASRIRPGASRDGGGG